MLRSRKCPLGYCVSEEAHPTRLFVLFCFFFYSFLVACRLSCSEIITHDRGECFIYCVAEMKNDDKLKLVNHS